MNRANRRAALDLLVHHVANWPASHVMGGKIFMLGGSTELTQLADGVYSGDLSGIAALRTPLWARNFTFPPPELATISDWEKKVEVLSRRCCIRTFASCPERQVGC